MAAVEALGYVVVSADDLDKWARFGEDGLGMQLASATAQSLQFRLDDYSWRFGVEQGPDGGLEALGFEVGDAAALSELASRLRGAGWEATADPVLAGSRGVDELVRVSDPSGVPLEFFHGPTPADSAFDSPTGVRFVTGAQGVGHAVIGVADVEETNAFYLELLGFRLTDVIVLDGDFEIYFTSPSPRHHSLAYSAASPGSEGSLHHVMFEVDDLDSVGSALDHCLDHGVPISMGLGKHTNDRMTSFYCQSPSGLTVEYGFGGRQIDRETHEVERYRAASIWGHRPPATQPG